MLGPRFQRTSQPQGAVPINPALRGVRIVWSGGNPFAPQPFIGAPSIPALGTPRTFGSQGPQFSSDTSTGARVEFTASAERIFQDTSRATIAMLRRHRDTTARADQQTFGYQEPGNNLNRVMLAAPWSDGNVYWDFGNFTTGRLSTAWGTKNTDWHTLVVVAGPTKGREIWRNGTRLASNGNTASATPTGRQFCLGSIPFVFFGDNEDVALFVVANAEWSDAEIRAWCRNPWAATYQPIERSIWGAVTGASAITGTLSATLGTLTSSATGALTITGTASATLGELTSSAAGTLAIAGSASATLDALTSTATGTLPIVGTTSQTLEAASLAATGAVAITAATTQTLEAATLASTGALGATASGVLTATLAAVTSSATGRVDIAAALGVQLGDLTSASTGRLAIAGQTTQTLQALTATATGQQGAITTRTGVLSVTLADLVAAAEARAPRLTASPIGHGQPLASRTRGTLASRSRNLSTRTR